MDVEVLDGPGHLAEAAGGGNPPPLPTSGADQKDLQTAALKKNLTL